MWDFMFFFTAAMLGVGLAMDAFSMSLANGLSDPEMKKRKMSLVAGVFSFFQFLMPMIGWICVHTAAQYFTAFERFIPWIALGLLSFIGGKMIYEGIKNNEEGCKGDKICFVSLMVQGVATSIDALSVGFTISEYDFLMAVVNCLIIGVLTFFICILGLWIGKKFGTVLANKASIFGGIILVAIGIEIFITGIL